MNFPKRKRIRLKDYDYSQSGLYFVTMCLYKREHLFGKIVGRKIRQYRYHDYIIRNEKEYKVISEYIAQNPLKWAEDCYYKEDEQ